MIDLVKLLQLYLELIASQACLLTIASVHNLLPNPHLQSNSSIDMWLKFGKQEAFFLLMIVGLILSLLKALLITCMVCEPHIT